MFRFRDSAKGALSASFVGSGRLDSSGEKRIISFLSGCGRRSFAHAPSTGLQNSGASLKETDVELKP